MSLVNNFNKWTETCHTDTNILKSHALKWIFIKFLQQWQLYTKVTSYPWRLGTKTLLLFHPTNSLTVLTSTHYPFFLRLCYVSATYGRSSLLSWHTCHFWNSNYVTLEEWSSSFHLLWHTNFLIQLQVPNFAPAVLHLLIIPWEALNSFLLIIQCIFSILMTIPFTIYNLHTLWLDNIT